MLEFLRKSSQSLFMKIMMVGIALSFMTWGIGDMLTKTPKQPPAISVGDIDVSARQLVNDLNREIFRLRPLLGDSFSIEEAIRFGFHKKIIKQAISRAVLDMNAAEFGIFITDEQLQKTVYSMPEFQDYNKKFQRAIFNHVISQNNWTEDTFLNTIKRDIQHGHITNAVTKGTTVPKVIADYIYRYRAEKRKAESVTIKADDIKISKKPEDSSLRKYYEENKQRFMSSEQRSLTAIILTPENVMKGIVVSEDDIAKNYNDSIDVYTSIERRKVEQMLFEKEADAIKAIKKLGKDKSFKEIAKELLKQDEKETNLGWVTKDTMLVELAEKLFKSEKGATLEPIQSKFGWHVLHVTDIEPLHIKKLDEVRSQIITSIKVNRSYETLYDMSNQIEDTLAGGDSIEKAAEQVNVKTILISAMDINGLAPDGSPVLADFMSKDFLETAFNINEGEESSMIEADKGSFILRVDSVTPPAAKPFKTVKAKIINIWEQKQKNIATKKKAEAILAGKDFSKSAKKAGLKTTVSKAVTRFEKEKLASNVTAKLFHVKLGESFMTPVNGGYMVSKLKKIIPADSKKDFRGYKKVRKDILNAINNDLLSEYITAKSSQYDVTVNDAVIKAIFDRTQ